MFECTKCKQETGIDRGDISAGVVVSDCCYAPITCCGQPYTLWDYDQDQLADLADAQREVELDHFIEEELDNADEGTH